MAAGLGFGLSLPFDLWQLFGIRQDGVLDRGDGRVGVWAPSNWTSKDVHQEGRPLYAPTKNVDTAGESCGHGGVGAGTRAARKFRDVVFAGLLVLVSFAF